MLRLSLVSSILLAALAAPLFGQDNPLTAVDVKSAKPKPSPRTADGHPDLSGYWKERAIPYRVGISRRIYPD